MDLHMIREVEPSPEDLRGGLRCHSCGDVIGDTAHKFELRGPGETVEENDVRFVCSRCLSDFIAGYWREALAAVQALSLLDEESLVSLCAERNASCFHWGFHQRVCDAAQHRPD